ncbi:hypothetical protein BVY02_01765 [bacterium J17]|nr:hypothetical protein BVY02_01765 [bacterium J17]
MSNLNTKKQKIWSQPIRVECSDHPQLITSRTVNSRLWFVNNPKMEERILGFLAKYQQQYGVIIYAFVMVGNHYHLLAKFPLANRAAFCRDFNARIAEAARYYVKSFGSGPLFGRRYTCQAIPTEKDLEDCFYYCALQPVSSGLSDRISGYPAYNSFQDAMNQRNRTYRVFRGEDYKNAKRKNPKTKALHYWSYYTLELSVLSTSESASDSQYKQQLLKQLETRRLKLIDARRSEGKGFCNKELLRKVKPGSLPKESKTGGRRPLVLTICPIARRKYLEWYFATVEAYRSASHAFLAGNLEVDFPPGTYRPTCKVLAA